MRIHTELGDFLLSPLEVGHLREAVKQALLDSEITGVSSRGARA